MTDLAHPLPYDVATELELVLQSIPDREDTVFKIRRLAGRIYARGHSDGRMIASIESYYDHNAPKEGN